MKEKDNLTFNEKNLGFNLTEKDKNYIDERLKELNNKCKFSSQLIKILISINDNLENINKSILKIK
jgi:hypothetical protein